MLELKNVFGKNFIKYPCSKCGKLISNCGWGNASHARKHEREEEEKKTKKRRVKK
jgi:hypothetical protein